MYVPIPFDRMTDAEHRHELETLMLKLLAYVDGETFKTVTLAQDNDYFFKLLDKYKKEGKFGG